MNIMATKKYLLPSLEQCLALTDEQCRLIMSLRDPEGIRAQKNWELVHQAELIRQYMTMRSFTQIAQIMRSKLEWSYKTYANRYRDWLFPVDRVERELAIMDLYSLVTAGKDARGAEYSLSQPEAPLEFQPNQPRSYHRSQGVYNLQPKLPDTFQITGNYPNDSYVHDKVNESMYQGVSDSFVDLNTWSQRPIFDGDTSGHMPMSAVTSNIGQFPRNSVQSQKIPLQQRKQTHLRFRQRLQDQEIRFPEHNFKKGLWNSALNVIPCLRDHSRYSWERPFKACTGCGFSQCHALMIQARSIEINTFRKTLSHLRNHVKPDFAGNHPLSFLMVAGVGIEYFTAVLGDVKWSTFEQNSFTQSPLHVLNPKELEDELKNFLGMFTWQLYLRDSKCRTFLHYLFLHPLKQQSYSDILKSFSNVEHYLQTFDTSGRNIIQYMQEAASSVRSPSQHFRDSILNGIGEIKEFLRLKTGNSNGRPYGFLDIAKGTRGIVGPASDFLSPPPYMCPICNSTIAHSSSYYEQIICACGHGGIDRNAPDEKGWTAAHLIITTIRYNNDLRFTPETPTQTAELFRLLVFTPELREVLHVKDPYGNSLVYNIATRGHCAILEYALELEDERRRYSMVNSFGRSKNGEKRSVLEGVEMAVIDCDCRLKKIERSDNCTERNRLIELRDRLKNCRVILKKWGAEIRPSAKKQWRIY